MKADIIRTIIRYPSDMVMAFDKEGEQIPEYQGQYREVRQSILEDAPPDAIFGYFSDFVPELREVPREDW